MTESELKSAVIEMARMYKWKIHHDRPSQNSKGRWSTAIEGDAGFPDIVLARDGIVLFVELKSTKGRLSDGQTEWLAALSGGCNTVEVWRPVDWTSGAVQKALT